MAQIALAWVLNNPVVAAPIVGADTCTRSRTCSTSCISLWLGGVLALNVLQVRLGRGRDPVALGSLLCLADLYGRAVIAPVAWSTCSPAWC